MLYAHILILKNGDFEFSFRHTNMHNFMVVRTYSIPLPDVIKDILNQFYPLTPNFVFDFEDFDDESK